MSAIGKLFKLLGPGFVTGASDDDPSGIGTYSQTGAQFGYSQLWLALFSFPFMTVIQEMCGRIGMVSGGGLSRNILQNFPKAILYGIIAILFIANTINIGADLAAMASAMQLLWNLPFVAWLCFLTLLTVLLQVFVAYKDYAKILKYFAMALLAYIATAGILHLNWGEIIHETLVPKFSWNKDYLMNIVAILGTTISPYLFFWQSNETVESLVEENKVDNLYSGNTKINDKDIKHMRLDTLVGMLFSQIVMYCIIVTAAATLRAEHIHTVSSAAEAAKALKPIAGQFASILFTLGIVGTGLLAVPILAGSASYAISEAFDWKMGLSEKPAKAKGFYWVIVGAILIGAAIDFVGISPFKMLYYTAILNGLCAPPVMIIIMLLTNNRNIMGKYVNGKTSNILGWMITVLMTLAAIALLYMFATGGVSSGS